ncbi:MAG: sugar phosphate isomerase/epimerase family protein [Armatimonadota bacterium]|nr:sugar phosphate isomerase/epimerase family protein [Armatimonadota bacterium]
MRFAICNELFGECEFEEVCRAASEAGYTGVEIAPFTLGRSPSEISKQAREQFRKTADRFGLQIVGLHWLLAKTEGFHVNHPDEQVRSRTVAYLNELAELCADLGGTVMVFGSPQQRSIVEGLDFDTAWTYALDTFRRIVPTIEKLGLVFCLEPLAPEETNFINTADEAAAMIEQVASENFRLLLDVKAMSSESTPIPEIIRKHGSLLRHFHANDANKRGPGFGSTDFRPIAAALKSIGYSGWISVEVFDFSPDPITIANQSIAYLKGVFE